MIALILAAALALADEPPAPPSLQADPAGWWERNLPRTPFVADPLQGRRPRKGEAPIPIDNGVDPALYRLWNLQPLQNQLVRKGEIVLEVWVRLPNGVRQVVSRVTRRGDGRTFIQARAGLGCCAPEILRRVDIDAELNAAAGEALKAVATDPLWILPRVVDVDYGGGAVSALCVGGFDVDATLVVPGRSITLHRACDAAEIGSVGPAMRAALGPAMGRDVRFDDLFPRRANFTPEETAYKALLAAGGRLKPAPEDRPQPPAVAVITDAPDEPTPAAAGAPAP